MPINVADLRRTFHEKFGLEEQGGTRHERYVLIIDGRIVAQTVVSRGRGFEIGDSILRQMARQLNVSWREFKGGLDCTVSGEAFREAVQKGSQ